MTKLMRPLIRRGPRFRIPEINPHRLHKLLDLNKSLGLVLEKEKQELDQMTGIVFAFDVVQLRLQQMKIVLEFKLRRPCDNRNDQKRKLKGVFLNALCRVFPTRADVLLGTHVNLDHLFQEVREAKRVHQFEVLGLFLDNILPSQIRIMQTVVLEVDPCLHHLSDKIPNVLLLSQNRLEGHAVFVNHLVVVGGVPVIGHEIKVADVLALSV